MEENDLSNLKDLNSNMKEEAAKLKLDLNEKLTHFASSFECKTKNECKM